MSESHCRPITVDGQAVIACGRVLTPLDLQVIREFQAYLREMYRRKQRPDWHDAQEADR